MKIIQIIDEYKINQV